MEEGLGGPIQESRQKEKVEKRQHEVRRCQEAVCCGHRDARIGEKDEGKGEAKEKEKHGLSRRERGSSAFQ
jgi:hypothetical protein